MSDGVEEKPSSALVTITDLLGISDSSTRLVDAVVRGIGELSYPWTARRRAKADIDIFKQWSKALKQSGLLVNQPDLTVGDAAVIQLLSNAYRHQENRENISGLAVEAFRAEHETETTSPGLIEEDWIDRYWRHAERVYNADFQILWGRILARQALGTHNFTPRCLDALSLLTKVEAHTLEKLAPMVSGVRTASGWRYFLIYDVETEAAPNTPSEQVKRLSAANAHIRAVIGEWHEQMFGPIGIYASSEGSWAISVPAPFVDGVARFSVAGRAYRVEGYPASSAYKVENYPTESQHSFQHINIGHGLPFSAIGGEILGLLQVEPRPDYLDALKSAFTVSGLTMRPEG